MLLSSAAFNALEAQSAVQSSTRTRIVDSLENGLKYYIQSNDRPAKRAYLWLAVKAGALHEDEDQLGFAHFLEHMAFNGTRNFPGNTLIDIVEKSGMSFGADLNAYTSFDETVYQLTMPTDDSVLLNHGLMILQDWADGGILNDSIEVANERGVILGEWRARLLDSTRRRIQREGLERIFGKGTRYAERIPIGDPDLIRNANPAELVRFYKDWYRPDLMSVVVVGDFDAIEMEKQIKKRFGTTPRPKNPRHLDLPVMERNDFTTVTLVKDVFSPLFELSWPVPAFNADPKAAMREMLLETIAFPYLNRLALSMGKHQRRPFAGGGVGRSGEFPRQVGNRYVLRVGAYPDSLVFGFSSLLTELERLAQHGIPAQVLEREKTAILRRYEQSADGSSAISSESIAARFLSHYQWNGNVHLWTPEEALMLVKEVLPTINNEDIASFASRWRSHQDRRATVYIPKYSTLRFLTDTAVHFLIDSISKVELSVEAPFLSVVEHKGGASVASPVTGTVTEVEKFTDTGVSRFTLSNGAKVVHKLTSVNPDEIIIKGVSAGGHSLLPDSLFASPARLVAMLMTSAGGVGGKSHEEVSKDLSATGIREFRVDLNAFSEEMIVRGSPRDLELMFQLMHSQFKDPTIDTTALDEWRRSGGQTLKMSQNDILAARMGGHRRLAPPSPASVPFIDMEQAMRVYRERFGDASDFTFIVVGAVDAETIRPLLEKYIANLPSTNRITRESPKSFSIPNPTTNYVNYVEHPQQNPERAQMNLSFRGNVSPQSDNQSETESRLDRMKIQTVSMILGRRLLKRLREEMAVTYSVSAPVVFYRTPELRYYINISLLTPPEMIDTSTSVVWQEINALYNQGPTDEELLTVHTILTRRFENALQSNSFWVDQLLAASNNGESFAIAETFGPVLFTAEEIRQTAIKYLPKDVYNQGIIKPTAAVITASKEKQKKKDEATSR